MASISIFLKIGRGRRSITQSTKMVSVFLSWKRAAGSWRRSCYPIDDPTLETPNETCEVEAARKYGMEHAMFLAQSHCWYMSLLPVTAGRMKRGPLPSARYDILWQAEIVMHLRWRIWVQARFSVY